MAHPVLASFDVFDTLITRAVGDPTDVFAIVGEALQTELGPAVSPAQFRDARVAAEHAARTHAAGREATLDEIYAELRWRHEWTAEFTERVRACELETEVRLSLPLPAAIRLVGERRAAGERVVFVSDTYLSREFVAALLGQHRVECSLDDVFVSCEHRASKRRGRLFEIVLAATGVESRHATHYGNSQDVDIAGAKAAGLTAIWLDAGNLTRYEQRMLESSSDRRHMTTLAGIARRVRTHANPAPQHEGLVPAAAGVVAPVLVAYVAWLLIDAQRRGLDRLYFLSRDGEILLRVAVALNAKWHLGLGLHYLHGGRQAWLFPTLEDRARFEWLFSHSSALSIRLVLQRAGERVEDWGDDLAAAGMPSPTWDRPLTPDDRRALQAMLATTAVAERIQARASEARVLLCDYFRQEGLLQHPGSAGIVDVGWRGSMVRALCDVLEEESAGSIGATYFFGSLTDAETTARGRIQAYLFDAARRLGDVFSGRETALLVETFCAGTHGSVLGYARRGARVEPVLSGPRDEPAVRWGVEQVHHVVAAFADEFAGLGPEVARVDARQLGSTLLSLLWRHPSREDALAWGAFPLSDDPAGASATTFAVSYSWRHLFEIARTGYVPPSHSVAWPAASVHWTPRLLRIALEVTCRIRRREAHARFWA